MHQNRDPADRNPTRWIMAIGQNGTVAGLKTH